MNFISTSPWNVYFFSCNSLSVKLYNGLDSSITWQTVVGKIKKTLPSFCNFSVCCKFLNFSPSCELHTKIKKKNILVNRLYCLAWYTYNRSSNQNAVIFVPTTWASFTSQTRKIKQSLEFRWQITAFLLKFITATWFDGLVILAYIRLAMDPLIQIPTITWSVIRKTPSGHSSVTNLVPYPIETLNKNRSVKFHSVWKSA